MLRLWGRFRFGSGLLISDKGRGGGCWRGWRGLGILTETFFGDVFDVMHGTKVRGYCLGETCMHICMRACVRLLACCVFERIRASVPLFSPMFDIIKSKAMASMAAPSNSIISFDPYSPTCPTSFFPPYNPHTQIQCQTTAPKTKDPLPLQGTPYPLQSNAATSGLWSKTNRRS